jgi:hypothetical protein
LIVEKLFFSFKKKQYFCKKLKDKSYMIKRVTEETKTRTDKSGRQKSDRLTGRFAAIAASETVLEKISVIGMPLRQQAAASLCAI